jgi:hypothetical protein
MTDSDLADLEPGWAADGADGARIGPIEDLGPGYIVVVRGLVFQTEFFVPMREIAAVDFASRSVRLTVAADKIDATGWQEPVIDASGWDD